MTPNITVAVTPQRMKCTTNGKDGNHIQNFKLEGTDHLEDLGVF
jgi:hypothetical protein